MNKRIIYVDPVENPVLWEEMWTELEKVELNKILDFQGQVWEYMGSQQDSEEVIKHTFRHRFHPATHDRKYVHVKTQNQLG